MRCLIRAALVTGVVVVSGCYHAIIETGRPASGQAMSRPWANSFLWGLVPPPVWEAGTSCPNGVARVETQHSFLNSLVGALTFGIYTPMTLMVTCASGGSSDASPRSTGRRAGQVVVLDRTASAGERRAAFNAAAALAISSRAPVFVRFEKRGRL